MRRKTPSNSRTRPRFNIEENIFLETSEADLVGRWHKEIRSRGRKKRNFGVQDDAAILLRKTIKPN